jgi:uncharacterized protein YecT (DUF1311 family)
MQRGYDKIVPGTAAGHAGAGQAGFVRDNFMRLIAETIQAHNLKPASIAEYEAADHKLGRAYARDVRKESESEDTEKSVIEDYGKSARDSQNHWIKFRDLLAERATSLYRNHAKSFDPAVSIKMAMTKIRIAELRFNPIGPESD